jgi:M6 family metalloprotease-like protein
VRRARILAAAARAAALAGLAAGTRAAPAQQQPRAPVTYDVEMAAQAAGRPVPRGYYDRLRRQPDFFALGDAAAQAQVGRTGTMRVLVIPALFADSPTPTVSHQNLQRALFDGPAPWGTITELYREMSRGAFTLTGQVVPWVRTRLTLREAVGTQSGFGADARLGEYLVQALAAADSVVDFGEFDNDGPDGVPNSRDDNGIVDGVAFLFFEGAAPCGGPGPWPHFAGIPAWIGRAYASADRRPDGRQILVQAYSIQDATDCTGTRPLAPAVMSHEFGHMLGLPDLYDPRAGIGPANRRWIIGCWDLMSAGAWGCGAGDAPPNAQRPTHMGAWPKGRLGWVVPEVVGDVRDREYTLRAAVDGGGALRIPLGPDEYLELEFRRRAGFDQSLPATGGPRLPRRAGAPAARVRHVRRAVHGAPDRGGRQRVAHAPRRGRRGARRARGRVRRVGALRALGRHDAGAAPRRRLAHHGDDPLDHGRPARQRGARARDDRRHAGHRRGVAPGVAGAERGARTVRATGGTLPYAWSVSGALPRGVTPRPDADALTFAGAPREAGAFPVTVSLRDAQGREVSQQVALVVAAPALSAERLVEPFLGGAGPGPNDEELALLDGAGNRNGRYDVGDLRAALRGRAPLLGATADGGRAAAPPVAAGGLLLAGAALRRRRARGAAARGVTGG